MINYFLSVTAAIILTSLLFFFVSRQIKICKMPLILGISALNTVFCYVFPFLFAFISGVTDDRTPKLHISIVLVILFLCLVIYAILILKMLVLRSPGLELSIALPDLISYPETGTEPAAVQTNTTFESVDTKCITDKMDEIETAESEDKETPEAAEQTSAKNEEPAGAAKTQEPSVEAEQNEFPAEEYVRTAMPPDKYAITAESSELVQMPIAREVAILGTVRYRLSALPLSAGKRYRRKKKDSPPRPNDLSSYVDTAFLHMADGESEKAAECFYAALDFLPPFETEIMIIVNLCGIYCATGHFDLAKDIVMGYKEKYSGLLTKEELSKMDALMENIGSIKSEERI